MARLRLEKIEVGRPGKLGVRVAHLSDIHYPRNSVPLAEIAAAASAARPDLIALTGDIVDEKTRPEDLPALSEFLGRLTLSAPVYAVPGNHERKSGLAKEFYREAAGAGGVVLEDACACLTVRGVRVAVVGLAEGKPYDPVRIKGLSEARGADAVLLLAHRPDLFESYAKGLPQPFVALTGHAHGGQIRLFGRGLFAPDQGVFPKWTSGAYERDGCTMVVSRGLANHVPVPRLFNPCHIPVVTLYPHG